MTKVVIPVAGAGTMLRPHTHTQPKPLVPIAGKPILAHIIDAWRENGIKEFIFITGYLADKIETFVKENYGTKINATFVYQEPRKGSAHAIWVAKSFLEKEDFFIIALGDTIVEMDFQQFFKHTENLVALKKVEKPTAFGIAVIGNEGEVIQLVEKPRIPKSNMALVGVYKIASVPLFFESIQYLLNHKEEEKPSHLPCEYQLTEALMQMLRRGEKIAYIEAQRWFDCGKKDTLLEANATLLSQRNFETSLSQHYPTCIIRQPVRIGANCEISNAIIGPHVAIGDNTKIQNSIISNSIIGSYSQIENVVLNQSIIGNDSILQGMEQSLNLGDSAEISFKS
ncbi:sugar phosphate nucleotidyltransferase [Hugenholtzia roseola]|uniref:sugar phosphate nucleotidyltransferase n=1 Tax=Hugenholtzia roseola TaxID=1002 RepID=UPI00040A0001|nr:sugar phosphate nucleotidyltransferase [Hugenholtzia roseola]